MRKISTIFFLIIFITIINAEDRQEVKLLGQSLVEAIAANDIVAYSQCWVPTGVVVLKSKKFGMSKDKVAKMKTYFTLRGRDIEESFHKIQKMINANNVNRNKITVKSSEAYSVENYEKNGFKMLRAGGVNLKISDGDEEWLYVLDGATFVDGLWYFMDSPTNLTAYGDTLSFTDNREAIK